VLNSVGNFIALQTLHFGELILDDFIPLYAASQDQLYSFCMPSLDNLMSL
jgi:hypothetical protein